MRARSSFDSPVISRRLPENINRIIARFPEAVQEFFFWR